MKRSLMCVRRFAERRKLKGWTRKKKIALIESVNPKWHDLAEGWGEQVPGSLVADQEAW
jgi:hypothetical protein